MAQRRPVVVLAILSAAVLAGGVVLATRSSGSGGPRLTVIAVGGAIVGGLVLLVAIAIAKARRGSTRRAPAAHIAAEDLGLDYQAKGEPKYHARFAPLPGIPANGDVRHLMTGRWGGRLLTIFQHAYQVHTGQAPIPVYHTVYVTDAPPWPYLTVTRRNLLSRLLRRFGHRTGLQLEDETFNALRTLRTDDEDFAVALLGPDMQRLLSDKPAVAWSIQSGRVAMIYNGALRPDRMDASLERLRAFWDLVPPELEAWPADGA